MSREAALKAWKTRRKPVRVTPAQRRVLASFVGRDDICLEAETNDIMTHFRVCYIDNQKGHTVTGVSREVYRMRMPTFRALKAARLLKKIHERRAVNSWTHHGDGTRTAHEAVFRRYVLSEKAKKALKVPA